MKKLIEYEVYIPMPYCEVYIVKAESKEHVKRMIADNTIVENFDCIGEIASRKQRIVKLK